jgi:myo-inositol-1(or 4)-monophosphatase
MLEDIIQISKEAGEIIRNGFKQNVSVEFKTNESNLVTEIDKKSETLIIDFIKKKYPTHNIISEESGTHKSSSEYVWVIDPLDGTTNFAHGLPIFSISIGLQKNNKTIAGVVYDVMRNKLYTAEVGAGSFCDDSKLKVSDELNLERSLLVTGFPYNISENPNNAVEKFGAFIKKARAVRRLGSAAIDFCYVAEGVFEGFWEVSLNPWDICAGKLIVEEAGGIVTNFEGSAIDINSIQILASNGKIHQKMLEILNNY